MGSKSPSTTTQSTEPWAAQKPYLERQMKRAETAFDTMDKGVYGGIRTARRDPLQTQAEDMQLNFARGNTGFGRDVKTQAEKTLRGDYLNPETNTAFQGALRAMLDPVKQEYTNYIIPAITSAAQNSGAYGGARHGIALGEAAGNFAREAGNRTAEQTFNLYQTERNNQLAAPALFNEGISLENMLPQLMAQVGQLRRLEDQQQIDDNIAVYNERKQAPWTGLDQLNALIQGQYGGTVTGVVPGGSRLGGGIAGALGGASAGMSIGGPWGAGVGGILGALGGAFG